MISPDDAVRHTQHYVGSNPTPSKQKKSEYDHSSESIYWKKYNLLKDHVNTAEKQLALKIPKVRNCIGQMTQLFNK